MPDDNPNDNQGFDENAIAVVGMAGRFPGAPDVERLWDNLCQGVESITHFSYDEVEIPDLPPDVLANPAYVRAAGVLDGIDLFDADFFGFKPAEAELMDPQQRMFLETAWEALEAAGYAPSDCSGRVGLFAGTALSTYLLHYNLHHTLGSLMGTPQGLELMLATDKDFVVSRTAYKLNLRGPCVAVQTACSTSLVAVHFACQSLLSQECDLALAGGVSIGVPQKTGYLYQEGGIQSPDGHCRAFDADAHGTVAGNGVGAVVLKRLSEALEDGDHVHAVIRGSAVNNDGAQKVSYTAPSPTGQAEVIAEALAMAGIPPGSIGYVEAHGTGTALGDSIEATALTSVFTGLPPDSCALGSLKTNIGHLHNAAGVASLIKAALAVEHGLIPPTLHFNRLNPAIDFAHSPFYVATEPRQWKVTGPRRAGVSSFGAGGTNVHVVLEEPPGVAPRPTRRRWHLLPLAARTPAALGEAEVALAEALDSQSEAELADVAYTLQKGRAAFEQRSCVVVRTAAEGTTLLRGTEPARRAGGAAPEGGRPVVFLFPGQGTQYEGMAHDLYERLPGFRASVDRCAELLARHLGLDLRGVLYPKERTGSERLSEPALAQPALFTVEYALARHWEAWGVEATAMLGHGVGECVAACLAGVLELEDALELVAARGRLMQETAAGAMLEVALESFVTVAGSIELKAPQREYLSNVSGDWAREEEACSSAYWARQVRSPVQYAQGLKRVCDRWPEALLLEVGPGRTLGVLARQEGATQVVQSVRQAEERGDDEQLLLEALGRLWIAGGLETWPELYQGERRGRVPLPTYPFQRRRFWIAPAAPSSQFGASGQGPGGAKDEEAQRSDDHGTLGTLLRQAHAEGSIP